MLQRRDVLKSVGALPLAAILASPSLARAAASGLEEVHLNTEGGQNVIGFLAKPEQTPAPALLLIHEWWGLNDQIKAVTAEFAKQGYLTLAVDLMKGKVADTAEQARAQTQAVKGPEALDTLTSWAHWILKHKDCSGRIGTVGWCFGGGWSLNTSVATPVDATVIYYGQVTLPVSDLKQLKGPVLGHFGTQDNYINKEMVDGFEKNMAAAGKADSLSVYWYDANHAFANPTGGRYDKEDAATAWKRTIAFLDDTLK
mgnify:CR=1 FL=1